MKLLFLYSEIAGYFLAGLRKYLETYGGEVHVVRWPLNSEAPFQFKEVPGLTFYDRAEVGDGGLSGLIQDIDPDVVYVAGWMDKGYLKAVRGLKQRGIPVVCGLDNHWEGTLRQRVLTWLSPFLLKNRFSHVWTAGIYQFEYARRLGFARKQILTGMYTADTDLFGKEWEARQNLPQREIREIVYVGRLVEIKGVAELLQAYQALPPTTRKQWKLRIAGTGPLAGKLPQPDGVEYLGFVQPDDLPELARRADLFVLPSHFEPWGVVLHEFGIAGVPLLASDACGAHTAFLRNGYNGHLFPAGNPSALTAALKKLTTMPEAELKLMGERSHELARQITTGTWAATLHQLAKGRK